MKADASAGLVAKIGRLIAEGGWSQGQFARLADLDRLTVRRIVKQGECRVHSATVMACARALGLSVHELRTASLDALLPRIRKDGKTLHAQYERATQPELLAWLDDHADRARQLNANELDELFSLQGTGGPLTELGVEHFVDLIERKRRLKDKIEVIAGTHMLDMLEQLVDLMYDKIQPYRDRHVKR